MSDQEREGWFQKGSGSLQDYLLPCTDPDIIDTYKPCNLHLDPGTCGIRIFRSLVAEPPPPQRKYIYIYILDWLCFCSGKIPRWIHVGTCSELCCYYAVSVRLGVESYIATGTDRYTGGYRPGRSCRCNSPRADLLTCVHWVIKSVDSWEKDSRYCLKLSCQGGNWLIKSLSVLFYRGKYVRIRCI